HQRAKDHSKNESPSQQQYESEIAATRRTNKKETDHRKQEQSDDWQPAGYSPAKIGSGAAGHQGRAEPRQHLAGKWSSSLRSQSQADQQQKHTCQHRDDEEFVGSGLNSKLIYLTYILHRSSSA